MPIFKFGKLVRDKIVSHQIAAGAVPTYHQLDEIQHKEALVRKIIEEASEVTSASTAEVASEIADVQQALDDLKERYGLTDAVVAKAQAAKKAKNGAFKEGMYIETVEVSEDDPWTAYYRKNPDRYPEIRSTDS